MALDISKLDIVESEVAQTEVTQLAPNLPLVAAGETQPRPRPSLWQTLRRWWRGRTYNPYKSTSMAYDQDGEAIRYIDHVWQ